MIDGEIADGMRAHLRELESIADDVDELADECPMWVRQALLGKAARLYDVIGAIRHDFERVAHD